MASTSNASFISMSQASSSSQAIEEMNVVANEHITFLHEQIGNNTATTKKYKEFVNHLYKAYDEQYQLNSEMQVNSKN